MVKHISREELKEKIDRKESFVLVESLAPAEYERGHLPGAINIPSSQIGELSAALLPDKSTEVVVYCAGLECHASENAASELEGFGYTKIRVYREGKQGWVDAGLELEQSTGSESPATINHD